MSFDSNPPRGWYPDPDVPGGERYWDGVAWSDARRAPPPEPGQVFPPPPPPRGGGPIPGAPIPAIGYESSQAGWALGLSIIGFCCFILSIVGIVLGAVELNAISAGRRDPSQKGLAVAAIVIGVIVVLFGIVSLTANFSIYSDLGS